MSLSAKVNAAVDKAFAAAGDLVKQGRLSSKKVSKYDFATRKVVSSTSVILVDVIITTNKRSSGEGFSTSAIMKSGPDLSVYDTLTVDEKSYKIVDYNDNDFIIEVELSREVK